MPEQIKTVKDARREDVDLSVGPGVTFVGKVIGRDGSPALMKFIVMDSDVRRKQDFYTVATDVPYGRDSVPTATWYEGSIRVTSTGLPIPIDPPVEESAVPLMDCPVFEHDCKDCIYTGSGMVSVLGDDPRRSDFYYCQKGAFKSVIARYGSEGWEYTSMGTTYSHKDIVNLTNLDPRLNAAYEAGIARGYVEDVRNA